MIHTLSIYRPLQVTAFLWATLLVQACTPSPDQPQNIPSTTQSSSTVTISSQGNTLSHVSDTSTTGPPSAGSELKNTVQTSHPQKVEARYAEGFDISYHENYKLLEIFRPFQDKTSDTLRYALVPRELTGQVEIPNRAREIPIPVETIIATSTTHIALTEMLNANDHIAGMVGAEHVYSPDIRHRMEDERITGFPRGEFNKEVALAMEPDLIMISGGQSTQYEDYRVLMNAGIDVLVNAEWLETTPLGKAEWVKVMAALLNREQEANRQFEAVARRYHELREAVEGREEKPLIINNLPYKGAWFVSGGDSYTAQFLKDAGADYPWYDSNETGGLRKSFEVVYEIGLQADIWIQPGAAESKQEVLATDERFRDFKAFQNDAIYNNNKRLSPSGGNDFWETGVVRPDLVLSDLIQIFHPDAPAGDSLYFYQELH